MSVYMSRGHAFILLSSLTWSWVFDLNTGKWAERNSYNLLRSRITGGIGVFGKWLCGDTQTGNIQEITSTTYQEIGNPFRMRLESGPVEKWPVGERIGRADFNFVTGVGQAVGTAQQRITGAVVGTLSRVRITIASTATIPNGGAVSIAGVGGTTEANGTWPVAIINATQLDLVGTTFVHAYTSGGTLTNLTPLDPIETNPMVEISWSDDGGQTYWAPFIRRLGRQSETGMLVSLIACTGRSSWNGRRWRLDVSDPVYVGFMGATQSDSPLVRVNK
jgi:hypothetical protein